jgi:hypothetical protein
MIGEARMAQTLYRFDAFDIVGDEFKMSTRWGTASGIHNIGGRQKEPGVLVSDDAVGGEVAGLTERNFDREPHKPDHPNFHISVKR